jgi:hypothetical protein
VLGAVEAARQRTRRVVVERLLERRQIVPLFFLDVLRERLP